MCFQTYHFDLWKDVCSGDSSPRVSNSPRWEHGVQHMFFCLHLSKECLAQLWSASLNFTDVAFLEGICICQFCSITFLCITYQFQNIIFCHQLWDLSMRTFSVGDLSLSTVSLSYHVWPSIHINKSILRCNQAIIT